MSKRSYALAACGLIGVVAFVMGGCVVTVTPIEPEPNSPPTTITIRIKNDTSRPLDPQIYIAPADVGAANIFQPQYKRTNFGFGNLGTLLPLSEVTLTVTCGELGLIGTDGGVASENLTDPNAPKGTRFVFQEGASVQCGYILEFNFDLVSGRLVNGYGITPQGG